MERLFAATNDVEQALVVDFDDDVVIRPRRPHGPHFPKEPERARDEAGGARAVDDQLVRAERPRVGRDDARIDVDLLDALTRDVRAEERGGRLLELLARDVDRERVADERLEPADARVGDEERAVLGGGRREALDDVEERAHFGLDEVLRDDRLADFVATGRRVDEHGRLAAEHVLKRHPRDARAEDDVVDIPVHRPIF